MKLSLALVQTAIAANDLSSRHPLHRLEELNQLVEDHLTQWFSWLPSQQAWINKFRTNGNRMVESFYRCGHYDETLVSNEKSIRKRRDYENDDLEEFNQFNASNGMKVLVNGYRKWAERHLFACAGQKKHKHREKRMGSWDDKLQTHLENAGGKYDFFADMN